jgi:hypothetical protein
MRRPRVIAIGILVATAGLSACSGSAKSSATTSGAALASPGSAPAGLAPLATAPSGGGGGASTLGRTISAAQPQIVRTGDVQVQVKHGTIQEAFDRIAGATTGAGGFVADSNMSSGESPSARLVLRVANSQVQPIVAALSGVGRITQQSLKGQDVTGQVVDLAARVTVLQSEADAVRTLLSRAAAIGDILQIQNQLFDLQTQIEQLNGQRATLADQTTWATISVELTEATGELFGGRSSGVPPFTGAG